MEAITTQPGLSSAFGGRDVIRKAEIDVDSYAQHASYLAGRWSFVPFAGCIFCQPCRYCCWASSEGREQANAISLVLYDNELEFQLKSHKIRCPCTGAAPPPRPFLFYPICGIVPNIAVTVPLRNIQKVVVHEFQGIKLLQVVYSTGQPQQQPNRPAPCASITVKCIKNPEAFRDAIMQQKML